MESQEVFLVYSITHTFTKRLILHGTSTLPMENNNTYLRNQKRDKDPERPSYSITFETPL